MAQQRVDQCLEMLCGKGCSAVWRDIAALEAGQRLPETQDLSVAEQQEVLVQLKSVMSVYHNSCSMD